MKFATPERIRRLDRERAHIYNMQMRAAQHHYAEMRHIDAAICLGVAFGIAAMFSNDITRSGIAWHRRADFAAECSGVLRGSADKRTVDATDGAEFGRTPREERVRRSDALGLGDADEVIVNSRRKETFGCPYCCGMGRVRSGGLECEACNGTGVLEG